MKKNILFLIFSFFVISSYTFVGLEAQTIGRPSRRPPFVDRINEYRATLGLPALQRWTTGEACADRSAQQDADANSPHLTIGSCGEKAQNTAPGYDSLEQVLSYGLESMWNEGPPPTEPCVDACFDQHGHYINMTKSDIKRVAIGIYQMPNGKYWVNMNFQ